MGCPAEVVIEDNLVFSICTHDPDTGVLTDADDAPAYRVYEDETAGAILNGTMTTLDAGNTDGFYTELIACTAANGFENGKNYTVYITATVDGDTGGICYGFKAITGTVNEVIEGAYTLQDAFKIMLAYMGGKTSGGGTTTVTFRDTGDGTDRVVQTVDANGNRSAVVLDVT